MVVKRIYAIEAWCIDCKRCEVACKAFHSPSKNAVIAFKAEGSELHNRVRVEGDKKLSLAINCRHCAEPLCVEGCISGAMTKNPHTGVVTSNPEKCVGCRTCVSLCPFGCVRVEEVGLKALACKCDLCGASLGEPGEPSCVKACPNRALIYVESEC